jgi:protein-S-isoprenylcysteine O-methyltransferase Ste14
MKPVLVFLGTMVLQYLLIAFVNWDINPGEWSEAERFFYASVCTTVSVGAGLLSWSWIVNSHNEK